MSYFDTADILQTTSEDGEVRCNLGDSRDGTGFVNSAAVWGLDGFISRPNDPTADGAAQGLYVVDGNQVRVVASRDNRFAAQVGALQPGDRAIVTDGDARIFVKQEDNAVILYTVSAKKQGNMMVRLGGSDGKLSLFCDSAWIEISDEEIVLSVAGSQLKLDKTGVQIIGPHFHCDTGGGHLGTLGFGVAPPVGVRSILVGPTALAGAPSAGWTVAL